MRSFSFLLSRRWILFLGAVLVLSAIAWLLGQWQFNRLEERQARNEVIEQNVHADPVPVDDVLAVGEPVAADEHWKRVTATGTYSVEDTVIVRYRTRDGASGVDVVVPLVQDDGPALLVDRGWMATDNRGASSIDEVPAPPPGEVTITGWVRGDAKGDSTKVTDQSTRAISSTQIGEALDLEVYGGFIDLLTEQPGPQQPLAGADSPETGSGPHFFYGLQWWFFGLLAVVGFFWMMFEEWRGEGVGASRRRGRRPARRDRVS